MEALSIAGIKSGMLDSQEKTGWITDDLNAFCKDICYYADHFGKTKSFSLSECVAITQKHVRGTTDAIKDACATFAMYAMYPMYCHFLSAEKCDEYTLYIAMEAVYRAALKWNIEEPHKGTFFSYAYVAARNNVISWIRSTYPMSINHKAHNTAIAIKQYQEVHPHATMDDLCFQFNMTKSQLFDILSTTEISSIDKMNYEEFLASDENTSDNIIDELIHDNASKEILNIIHRLYGLDMVFIIKYYLGPYVGCQKLNIEEIRDQYCKYLALESKFRKYCETHDDAYDACYNLLKVFAFSSSTNNALDEILAKASEDVRDLITSAMEDAKTALVEKTGNMLYKHKMHIYRKIKTVFPTSINLAEKEKSRHNMFLNELNKLGLYSIVNKMNYCA